MAKIILNARDKREEYRQKRKTQLAKVATLQNNMIEDDLELYYEMRPFRIRANMVLGVEEE